MLNGGVKVRPKIKSRNPILGLNKNVSLANINLNQPLLPPVPKKSQTNSLMDELTDMFSKVVKLPKSRVKKVKGTIAPSRRSVRIASIPQPMDQEIHNVPDVPMKTVKSKTTKKSKTVTTPAATATVAKSKSKREPTDSKNITTKQLISKIKSIPFAFRYSKDKQFDKLNRYFNIVDNKLRELQQKSLVGRLTEQDTIDLNKLRKYNLGLKNYLLTQLQNDNIEKGIPGSYYQTLLDLETQQGGKSKKRNKA